MQYLIVNQERNAVLVEWRDGLGLHRAVLPADALNDDLTPAVLAAGIPYGAAWELVGAVEDFPQRVALALRERGIWTVEDLHKDLSAARGALAEAYGYSLKTLLEGARSAQGGRDE